MKRSELLNCANVDLGRFKVLNQRGKLPFHAGNREAASVDRLMKRGGILRVSECAEKRFDTILQRNQLPFARQEGRWADYTAEDAFRLGLMLAATDEAGMKLGIARDMAMQVSVGPHIWEMAESGDLWAVAFLVCDIEGATRFTYDLNRKNDIAWRDAGNVVSATFVNAAKVVSRVLAKFSQEAAA